MTLLEDMARLAARNAELQALDTELSQIIGGIEEGIRRCTSVRIAVEIGPGTVLSYGKFNGTWRLMIERDVAGREPVRTPLTSCSREDRARVFKDKHVANLIKNADADVIDQIGDRKEALAEALSIRDQLFGGGS